VDFGWTYPLTNQLDNQLLTDLEAFLGEDLGRGDVTSEAVVAADASAVAKVVAHQGGVVAGLDEAAALCRIAGVETSSGVQDSDDIVPDDEVLELRGPAHSVLGVERTLLNLLSHMSGVASATRAVVAAAEAGARAAGKDRAPLIAATRKTLPGLRRFQKRAVVLGGGDPHRADLSSAVLIKENHLAFAVDIPTAIADARRAVGDAAIEAEVETLDEALAAARAGADTLLLDNMSADTIEEVCAALASAGLRDTVRLEVSGGITIHNVGDFARLPIDVISMSAITMDASPLDFSLDIVD